MIRGSKIPTARSKAVREWPVLPNPIVQRHYLPLRRRPGKCTIRKAVLSGLSGNFDLVCTVARLVDCKLVKGCRPEMIRQTWCRQRKSSLGN